MPFLYNFRVISWITMFNIFKSEKTIFTVRLFGEKHFRTTLNESKRQKTSICSRFYTTYVHILKFFGVKMLKTLNNE